MTTIATITYKNQLTLPSRLVAELGLSNVRRVLISSHGDEIVLWPIKSTAASLAGSLAHLSKNRSQSIKAIRKQTMALVAKDVAHEGLT